MPRKTKLTRKLIDELAGHVANGHTVKDSAALSGISERSVYKWLELAAMDPTGKAIHSVFAARMEQAKSRFIDVHLGRVAEASKEDPKFSQWLLERKAPEEFGRMKVEHAGKIEHVQRQEATIETCKVIYPGDPEWRAPRP